MQRKLAELGEFIKVDCSHDEAKKAVQEVLKSIRKIMPKQKHDLSRAAYSEVKVGYLHNKAIERVIVVLRSSGCAWALQPEGGCSMCGHLVGTTQGKNVDHGLLKKQFQEQLTRYDFRNYPMLCLYNSGSFFNPDELPAETRIDILKSIAKVENIKSVIFESRAEYVNSEVLEEIEYILGDRRVEIGIGLETLADDVRDLCLNKGMVTEEYLGASRTIAKSSSKLLTYVLIKPPFLSEQDGYNEAVKTASFAFDSGTDVVSFEPVSVQDYTLTHYLYEASMFRPPWIWSVFKVAQETAHLGEIRLGGFEFMPVPKIFAHNCDGCNRSVIKALDKFNCSSDAKQLLGHSCECQQQWEADWAEDGLELSLPERILRTLGQIDQYSVLQRMQSTNIGQAA